MKTQKHYARLFWRYKRLLPYRKKITAEEHRNLTGSNKILRSEKP